MNWLFGSKEPLIEFRCYEDDFDAIPKPFPASEYHPKWYKPLSAKITDTNQMERDLIKERFRNSPGVTFAGKQQKGFKTSTIKRCIPFVEALSAGWIIPLAFDVHVRSNEDCSILKSWWPDENRPMIEDHSKEQINSTKKDSPQHPQNPKSPYKWMNYWSIKTPPGYSCMFLDPLNRHDEQPFSCFEAIVETDKYPEFINFPFFWNVKDFNGLIPAGTPLIQVIPFKRDSANILGEFHAFTKSDLKHLKKTRRRRQVHESYYRDIVSSFFTRRRN